MGVKINDTAEFPATTPAATDRVLGIDVSNTTNDANGEVVTFTINSIPLSLLDNDAGFLTSVSTADVTAAGALMDSEVTNLAQVKAFDTTDYATAAQGSTADSALQDVVSDTTPQLGGSLDVNGNKIVSTTNGNIDIEPNGTGNVLLGNLTFDADQTVGAGQDDYVLTYDNAAGTIGLEAAAGGGGGLVPISKTTASNDSAVDIELTGGYSQYQLRFYWVHPVTDGATMRIGMSSDGGTTFTQTTNQGSQRQGSWAQSQQSYLNTRMDVGNSGFNSERAVGVLDIMVGSASHPNSYILRSGYQDTNLNDFDISLFAVSNAWAAVTDIRCYFSSGNINTGVFHLYGIADGA